MLEDSKDWRVRLDIYFVKIVDELVWMGLLLNLLIQLDHDFYFVENKFVSVDELKMMAF